MANQWFRMYYEFMHDPKVQTLSEVDQRRYVMMLCMKCCNGDVTLQDEDVAFLLRIDTDELVSTKARLIQKGLVSDTYQPLAWDKRQFVSDSSAARVARHREKKKQACNVTVTPPDTDTDTEEEKKSTQKKRRSDTAIDTDPLAEAFAVFWALYPHKANRAKSLAAYRKLKPKPSVQDEILAGLRRYIATKPDWQQWAYASSWLNGRRWEDESHAPTPADNFMADQRAMLAELGVAL